MPARPVRRPRNQRQPRLTERRVSFDLGHSGRMANACIQVMATLGIARRRGVDPVFPAAWPYRPFFAIPDNYYADDLSGTIPASTLAVELPPWGRTYLQSVSLWRDVETEARALLAPSPLARSIVDDIWGQSFASMPTPITAIHVRRGDTAWRNPPDTIQPLPASYFRYAVLVTDPESVVVFSDDPEWCAEHLPDTWTRYVGVPGPMDYEDDYDTRERRDWVDMMLMWRVADRSGVWPTDSAGAIVTSNSSYSWLAAYLADTDRVTVPSRWYGRVLAARGHTIEPMLDPRWTVGPVDDG